MSNFTTTLASRQYIKPQFKGINSNYYKKIDNLIGKLDEQIIKNREISNTEKQKGLTLIEQTKSLPVGSQEEKEAKMEIAKTVLRKQKPLLDNIFLKKSIKELKSPGLTAEKFNEVEEATLRASKVEEEDLSDSDKETYERLSISDIDKLAEEIEKLGIETSSPFETSLSLRPSGFNDEKGGRKSRRNKKNNKKKTLRKKNHSKTNKKHKKAKKQSKRKN
jgi:hypothetical protein